MFKSKVKEKIVTVTVTVLNLHFNDFDIYLIYRNTNRPSYTPPSCLPLLCEPWTLPSGLGEALTLPFTEEACGSSLLVGGKGSQLGLLSSIQHKVLYERKLSLLSYFVSFSFLFLTQGTLGEDYHPFLVLLRFLSSI